MSCLDPLYIPDHPRIDTEILPFPPLFLILILILGHKRTKKEKKNENEGNTALPLILYNTTGLALREPLVLVK